MPDERTQKRPGALAGGGFVAAGGRAAGGVARPDGDREGGHAGRGAPRCEPHQPLWPQGGKPGAGLCLHGDAAPAPGCHLYSDFRDSAIPIPAREAPDAARGGCGPVQRHGKGKQSSPLGLPGGLYLRRRGLHLCGHPVRAAGHPGRHGPRALNHPARAPVRRERRHRPGHPVLSGDPLRRHRRQRGEGGGQR